MIASGDVHRAIAIAIAVLVITCPCALGLAVPMVHVVAARRLFECGIMIKDGSALEQLADVDTVIFDKTGTLTAGLPQLTLAGDPGAEAIALAATLAAHSHHPYSRALARLGELREPIALDAVAEYAGAGLEAGSGENVYRLGRPDWCAGDVPSRYPDAAVVLSANGKCVAAFHLHDQLRTGAPEAIAELTASGLCVEILSGDNEMRVGDIADRLGVTFTARARPADKVSRITMLRQASRKVLMVGDGLNDAPALMAADVSMAPASAADIGRNAADLVFLRENLQAVPQTIAIARKAAKLVRQNFGLAIAYNFVAIPVAVLGQVTPLTAAVAMSLSSVVVVVNALRLDYGPRVNLRVADRAGLTTSIIARPVP
jgi:Cu2+-exporting ATPase